MAGHSDGLCACGCGRTTPIHQRNRYDRGQIKGEHARFVSSHNSTHRPLVERFWAKVEKHDVDCPCCNGCWHWTGSRDHRGYGRIQRGAQGEGHVKTHRLSYEIHHGPADGLFVCHRCDNPPCCNPDHLFLGTHEDNMADASSKQRMLGSPFAVDQDELVAFVRAGHSYLETSKHFGVPKSTVYRTLKRNGALTRTNRR